MSAAVTIILSAAALAYIALIFVEEWNDPHSQRWATAASAAALAGWIAYSVLS